MSDNPAETIRKLFAKYGIDNERTAHEDIRARFSAEDLELYREALGALFHSGSLG